MNVSVSTVYVVGFAVETVPPSRLYVIVYVIGVAVPVTVISFAGIVNVFPMIAAPSTVMPVSV